MDVSSAALDAYTPPVILDPGEHELWALAQTLTDPLVLLDDEVARTEARRLQLQVRGTLGVRGRDRRARARRMRALRPSLNNQPPAAQGRKDAGEVRLRRSPGN